MSEAQAHRRFLLNILRDELGDWKQAAQDWANGYGFDSPGAATQRKNVANLEAAIAWLESVTTDEVTA